MHPNDFKSDLNFSNSSDQHSNWYEILELTPDATPQEIRSAYLRLKSAYGKDNIAHYTLFSREETEATLQNVESAYLILSNPEKRRAYDVAQGHHVAPHAPASNDHSVSNFAAAGYGLGIEPSVHVPVTSHSGAPVSIAPEAQSSYHAGTIDFDSWIQNETEWGGPFLRRVREAKRMTLEDLSDYTRISRNYLSAIEDEKFDKLPALVYVRGFLQQIGKRLKLPLDPLMTHYIVRMKNVLPDKG